MTEKGRVIANFRAAVAVQLDSGELVRAMPLTKLPMLVAGDVVDYDDQRITRLHERATVLQRGDARGKPRPLAANLTHLAIVSAHPPGIDTLLIDQFCVAAENTGISPIIILNKIDLYEQTQRRKLDLMLKAYSQMGYHAIAVSRDSAEGMQALLDLLQDKSVAFVGASGVGKSSLIKFLLPDRDVREGEISAATGFGSHTTSVTYWYEMGGGSIIDSPGVRQFTFAELNSVDVRNGYIDIARAGQDCKFANCSHRHEPSCAVKRFVDDNTIAQWRYENYIKLTDEP
ncbi:MAG: ribosome small subunit-dependent GTPase A [Granulosicoccaceae bacterium]